VTRSGAVVIALLFLLLRFALLFWRQPFFDELFTVWIAAKPFAGIVSALRFDSGPPLYYFIVHALFLRGVLAARLLSLACASVTFALLCHSERSEEPGRAGRHLEAARPPRSLATLGMTAACLYAIFPPAVLFAVDARSYAMCAMFVTFGVLAIARDRYGVAAASFVLAAYSHYYGALFFPLLVRRPRALIAAAIAFAPGFWLATHQPKEAMGWIGGFPSWPDALFVRPPLALLAIAIVLIVVAAIQWNRFLTMAAVPLGLALLLAVVARPVYFPLRFEAVIAPPLMLGIAEAFRAKRIPAIALGATFLFITAIGIADHRTRPPDEYRLAAIVTRSLPRDVPLVATGYLYLETVVNSRPDAIAWPEEQAQHPGWRAIPNRGSAPPPGVFFWVGERFAPELAILRQTREVEPVYVNSRAVVARVR